MPTTFGMKSAGRRGSRTARAGGPWSVAASRRVDPASGPSSSACHHIWWCRPASWHHRCPATHTTRSACGLCLRLDPYGYGMCRLTGHGRMGRTIHGRVLTCGVRGLPPPDDGSRGRRVEAHGSSQSAGLNPPLSPRKEIARWVTHRRPRVGGRPATVQPRSSSLYASILARVAHEQNSSQPRAYLTHRTRVAHRHPPGRSAGRLVRARARARACAPHRRTIAQRSRRAGCGCGLSAAGGTDRGGTGQAIAPALHREAPPRSRPR